MNHSVLKFVGKLAKLSSMISLTSLLALPAFANANEACAFIPRASVQDVLSEVNKSVVGLAACNASPDLNSFLVGKFKTLDEAQLKSFLRDVTITADGTAKTETIVWQSSQPLESRQFLIKTESPANASRARVDVMMHYAFVARASDHSYLVYVHTTHEKAAARLKRSFPNLNHTLSAARFTASVH